MAVLSARELFIGLPCLTVVYLTALVLYRLYLSPLAKFPGPKLAASTLWYEFYYDVVKRGRYTWKIAELHAQYGPIIRISPYELHIDDPEYYDELYVGPSQRKSLKYEYSVRGFGPTNFTFSTIGHEHHRLRRAAIAPLFSKALIQQFEPSVQAMIDKLMSRLQKLKGSGTVINMIAMYPCLTSDIICQYAFASPYGYLDEPEFAPLWHKAVMDASEGSHFFKQFPWLESMMRKMPTSIVRKMVPGLAALFQLVEMVHDKVGKVQSDFAENKKVDSPQTIFHSMIANNQLPPEEKTTERLEAEGAGVVAAGAMTVAHTLSVISYHIIANPNIQEKLEKELEAAFSDPASPVRWGQLEQLPYLSAIIQEGLRWAPGVSHRLQRISPDIDLHYKDWTIPRGTPVGMTSILMHENPSLFPNPRAFDPDRWLQADSARLRKYIVAFTKGSRQCLGIK
ncbi:MAG: hypothetical protein Q9195_008796 [Heterodermia aff. obscurata]